MKTIKLIMLGLVAATATASAQPKMKGYDKENWAYAQCGAFSCEKFERK